MYVIIVDIGGVFTRVDETRRAENNDGDGTPGCDGEGI
jgi:hypothetical protein